MCTPAFFYYSVRWGELRLWQLSHRYHAIATYAMSTTRAALRVASRAFGGLPARAATAAAVRARAAPLVRQRRLSTETVQFTFIDSDGDTFRAPPRVFAHAPNFSRHRRAPTQR